MTASRNPPAFDFRPDGAVLAESRLSTVARQWDMAHRPADRAAAPPRLAGDLDRVQP